MRWIGELLTLLYSFGVHDLVPIRREVLTDYTVRSVACLLACLLAILFAPQAAAKLSSAESPAQPSRILASVMVGNRKWSILI